MRKVFNPNLEILEIAVARLGVLVEEMVFLGGCATGLLITDVVAPLANFAGRGKVQGKLMQLIFVRKK